MILLCSANKPAGSQCKKENKRTEICKVKFGICLERNKILNISSLVS